MGCGMLTGVGLLQPRWFFGLSYATYRIIRNETLIEKDIWRFLSIVFDLERTNQLSLLPDKDLVDLCSPIEPYQITKNRNFSDFRQLLSIYCYFASLLKHR
jgi:hypothetical protein